MFKNLVIEKFFLCDVAKEGFSFLYFLIGGCFNVVYVVDLKQVIFDF